MAPEQEIKFFATFMAADSDNDGCINEQEFYTVMKELKLSQMTGEFLYKKVRKNDKGLITWDEFLTRSRKVLREKHYSIEDLRESFHRYDRKKMGKISLEDLQRAFKEYEGYTATLELIQNWLNISDSKKQELIGYDEFLRHFGY